MFTDNQVKRLKNHNDPLRIMKRLFPVIGCGSSRIVYKLSENKVLKVAFNNGGIYQNKYEMDLYLNHSSPVLNKIFIDECDPEYIYTVHEYCTVVSELDDKIACNFEQLKNAYYSYSGDSLSKLKKCIDSVLSISGLQKNLACHEFVNELAVLSKSINSPMIYDIHSHNVGFKDGKYILIDYGYHVKIYDNCDYSDGIFPLVKSKKEPDPYPFWLD